MEETRPFSSVWYTSGSTRCSLSSGVGLGACVSRARYVSDGMFLDAAKALAANVTQEDLDERAVYPRLDRIRDCSHAVACAVIRRAVAEGHADAGILVENASLEEALAAGRR